MKRTRRILFRILRVVVVIYLIWCAALYFMQDGMIFPASMAGSPRVQPFDDTIQVLRLPINDDQEVQAWFAPAPHADAEHAAPLVVFFHGNAELIDRQEEIAHNYRELGFSVLLPEFRGYGRSGGRPSQRGIVADAVCFYDQVAQRPDVDRSHILFHGRSIGGAVAVQVAAQRKPAAMILQSVPANVAAMAHSFGVPAFMVRHPFHTADVIADLDAPLLIFHGAHDTIIPCADGRRLRDAARHAVYVEYPCDHNDFPGVGNTGDYWSRIQAFVRDNGFIE